MKTAPGCRLRRCTTFCASTGRLRICSRDITLPTLASLVFKCVVSDTTVTVSARPPSSSVTLWRVVVSTCRSTRSTTAVLKPASSTFTLYTPGWTLLRRKVPRPSVVVTCDVAVAPRVTVTVAPGITCFCESVTSPTRAAVPVCACAGRGNKNGQTTTQAATVQACNRDERGCVKASSKRSDKRQLVPAQRRSLRKSPRSVRLR